MNERGKISLQDSQIRQLLNNFLFFRVSRSDSATDGQHLDEDSFAAFVEGNLSEREARHILRHLVDCSFCRHVTTELIRLDYAFADQKAEVAETSRQPIKVSEVLSNLLSRIFGANDGTVFAHQEDEDGEKAENLKDKKD